MAGEMTFEGATEGADEERTEQADKDLSEGAFTHLCHLRAKVKNENHAY